MLSSTPKGHVASTLSVDLDEGRATEIKMLLAHMAYSMIRHFRRCDPQYSRSFGLPAALGNRIGL
jgi:hypothetical protein